MLQVLTACYTIQVVSLAIGDRKNAIQKWVNSWYDTLNLASWMSWTLDYWLQLVISCLERQTETHNSSIGISSNMVTEVTFNTIWDSCFKQSYTCSYGACSVHPIELVSLIYWWIGVEIIKEVIQKFNIH